MASKRTYASDTMTERRARILREARELLASGAGNLTINRLCERAGVAPRTIYRAFEDRDGVIQAAIAEHMETIQSFLALSPPRADTISIFREYDWIAAELFRGPDFAKVIVDYYFSQTQRAELLRVMQSVARARIDRWLAHAGAEDRLLPGLDHEQIALHQVDGEYVVFHNWAAGLLAEGKVADALKANFAMTAAAVTRGGERDELVAELSAIHNRLAV